jgi:hypothetical protein
LKRASVVAIALFLTATLAPRAWSQPGCWTVNDLLALDEGQLLALYSSSSAVVMPCGKVKGTPLINPGTRSAKLISKGARVCWQGKVFHPEEGRAVNRFFGVPSVPGALSTGPSRLDGRPALILDYAETSLVYEPYRDEIRQVSPGLYLGLMYDRRTCPASLKLMFVLEDQH